MKYCMECGQKLVEKECGIDGMVPYCTNCEAFRFPTFNSAISTILLHPDQDKVLLIKQYGKQDNILVAGYINKGESANEALLREIQEEVGLAVRSYEYNDNRYFPKTNTLIHNFIAVAKDENVTANEEVDSAKWFPLEEAIKQIKPNSLGKYFLFHALHKLGKSELLFTEEQERIYMLDENEEVAAKLLFPYVDDHYEITTTYTDASLRGLGIADRLMHAFVQKCEKENKQVVPICSYAKKWFAKHKEKAHLLYDAGDTEWIR